MTSTEIDRIGRSTAVSALAGAAPALAHAQEQFFPLLVVPHRPLRAQRHALGQRQAGLPQAGQRAAAASTA